MCIVIFAIWLWACLTGVTIVNSTDVRLIGGSSPNQGRIEIQKNGVWGTYCGDSLDVQVAMVICRQVGFPGAAFAFQSSQEFGLGSGPVYYDGYMSCGGTEKTIDDCYFKDYRANNCTHSKVAGVICIEPGYEGCYQAGSHFQDNLFPKGSNQHSVDGCLELCRNSSKSYAAISKAACFCVNRRPSAPHDSLRTDDDCNVTCAGNARQKCGSAINFSIYSSTDGFCNELTPPENGSIDTSKTRYGTTVTFSCSPGFKIMGARKLQCLRNETHPSEFKWDGVTPTCTVSTLATLQPMEDNAVASLSIGLCTVAVCIVAFSSVIICAIRRKQNSGNTTSTTTGASFSPSPTETVNLPEHDLQQFQQRVPVSHDIIIPTSTTTVHVRNESMPSVALHPPNASRSQTHLPITEAAATVVSEDVRRRSPRPPVPAGRSTGQDDGRAIRQEASVNTETEMTESDRSQIDHVYYITDVEEESDDEDEQGDDYVMSSGPKGQSGPPVRPRGRADPRNATTHTSDDRRNEYSQVDDTKGTSQGDDYVVPLAKAEQPGPKGNGSRSRTAAAGPTDVDYLEVLPDESTSIYQTYDRLRPYITARKTANV